MTEPIVFISYSWDPPQNKEWVIQLAERLSMDGIRVLIDEWDLSEGQDKYKFMEKMVSDPQVKKVLLICNSEYVIKANNRNGGVGIEALIISEEIYQKADQKKFIPIITERDENGKAYLPTFVKTRIYIDLSLEDEFETNYQRLVRNIFDRPEYKRPKIGSPPPYIIEEEFSIFRTKYKIKPLVEAFLKGRTDYRLFINDFFETFIDEFTNLQFEDELLIRVEQTIELRNDFVEFLKVIFKYDQSINIEQFHGFFETLFKLIIEFEKKYGRFKIPNSKFLNEHTRFLLYEVFLYTITTAYRKEKFELIAYLLHNVFIFPADYTKPKILAYPNLNPGAGYLTKYRNDKLNSRRLNLTADLIKQRANISDTSFKILQEIDILLYYISQLKISIGEIQKTYFPNLAAYGIYSFDIFAKCYSEKYFKKVMPIFNVDSKEELFKLIESIKIEPFRLIPFEYDFPDISYTFNSDHIGVID